MAHCTLAVAVMSIL